MPLPRLHIADLPIEVVEDTGAVLLREFSFDMWFKYKCVFLGRHLLWVLHVVSKSFLAVQKAWQALLQLAL